MSTEFSTNMRQHDTMMAFLLPKLNLNQLSLIEDTSSFLMRMHVHSYSILHTLENKTEHSTKITSHDTLVSFSSNFWCNSSDYKSISVSSDTRQYTIPHSWNIQLFIVIRHCALIRSAYCDSVSQHAPVLYLRMYVSSNTFTYKWELIPSKSPCHNLLSLVDIVYQHDIQAKLESITRTSYVQFALLRRNISPLVSISRCRLKYSIDTHVQLQFSCIQSRNRKLWSVCDKHVISTQSYLYCTSCLSARSLSSGKYSSYICKYFLTTKVSDLSIAVDIQKKS